MTVLEGNYPFSKWRRRIWPVHGSELKKFIPLLFIKLCVSFNFSVLHSTKDTLIVTSKGSGAEVIPILKGWVVLFIAFLAIILYSKLSNRLSRPKLFYATFLPFLLFFALFGFVLYPHREWLTPEASANYLETLLGHNHSHWVAVYRHWMNSLFFVMAELWGGMVIGLLFWGFANQINTLSEAKRFYTMLSIGGHVGMITAGPLIWHYASTFHKGQYEMTVQYLMGIATLSSLFVILAYAFINRSLAAGESRTHIPEKTKLSLKESLLYILRSPYLGFIALMVIGYGLSVNMVEVTWKALLKAKYPDPSDYQACMGIVSFITGCVSLFLALFVGGNFLRKFGWYPSAQLTPLVLGIGSFSFYLLFFFNSRTGGHGIFLGVSSLLLVVLCGAAHNIACKSMKYCLFDPTKEMAYIPLDEEAKVKGKAAVDVVAARFGKSGSSWIQAGMMEGLGMSSILGITPYLVPCVALAIVGWLIAIYALNTRFSSLLKPVQVSS